MELLASVAKQLEINSTFYILFVISFAAFLLLKLTLFSKLLFVIQQRESNTKGLLESSSVLMDKANKLEEEYHKKISTSLQQIQSVAREKKNDLRNSFDTELKNVEKLNDQKFSSEIESYDKESTQLFEKVKSEAPALTNELANRLVN